MNSGRPVWHASIARWSKTAVIPIARWGDGVRREARRMLNQTLDGIGQGEAVEHVMRTAIAVHWRKALSDSEMAMLPEQWLAIPARDEFSPDDLIEMRL